MKGDIEQETIKIYSEKNKSDFNSFRAGINEHPFYRKQEDEKNRDFSQQIIS